MNKKQENLIYDITTRLKQINDAKLHLKTNQFRPRSSSSSTPTNLNLFEEKMFSILQLNEYRTHLSKSLILSEAQSFQLIKLCEFSLNDKFTLLYRGSRDGFCARDFHSKCKGHSPTLTIVQVKNSPNIFGGFTSATWDPIALTNLTYAQRKREPKRTNVVDPYFRYCKSDRTAFIFSLVNNDNDPCKMNGHPDRIKHAITCRPDCGPTFGLFDVKLIDMCSSINLSLSYTNLGHTYPHKNYAMNTFEAKRFLAGLESFLLREIEVYKKE